VLSECASERVGCGWLMEQKNHESTNNEEMYHVANSQEVVELERELIRHVLIEAILEGQGDSWANC
jgi:hypothetical protein